MTDTTKHTGAPDAPEPVTRTFTETIEAGGPRVFEYRSEGHTIRIEAAAGVDSHDTVAMLGKLARWIQITPWVRTDRQRPADPWDPAATPECPF